MRMKPPSGSGKTNPNKPNFTYPKRHALSYAEGGKTEVRCAPLSAHWLKCRNKDAPKKIVATGIFVFDFEFFIGVRSQKDLC
jgi:hypothetical protein